MYSAEYFAMIEEIFNNESTSNCLVNTIDNFFELIKNKVDKRLSKDMMIYYAGLDNNYTYPTLAKQLNELETEAGR